MRVGVHPCFERFVLEFADEGNWPGVPVDRSNIPGWVVAYGTPLGEATGEPIKPPLRGNAPMTLHFGAWSEGQEWGPPFEGPTTIYPKNTKAIREVRLADAFEGVSVVGIGVDRERPFRAYWLLNPHRLVVDIYTG
jgi:hypothetical protein